MVFGHWLSQYYHYLSSTRTMNIYYLLMPSKIIISSIQCFSSHVHISRWSSLFKVKDTSTNYVDFSTNATVPAICGEVFEQILWTRMQSEKRETPGVSYIQYGSMRKSTRSYDQRREKERRAIAVTFPFLPEYPKNFSQYWWRH